MNQLRLGFIGAGNMATAILDGVVAQHVFQADRIIISNPHSEKLEHPKALGVRVTNSNEEVVENSDIVILAVKPQMYEAVIEEICDQCAGKCIVSIAAGISTAWLRARVPDADIVRVMPNTPLQLGLGATAVASRIGGVKGINGTPGVLGVIEVESPVEESGKIIDVGKHTETAGTA